MASEVYVKMSDWALKSSGATIDTQRTSETYDCKENWGCRISWFFRTANPPDTILEPPFSQAGTKAPASLHFLTRASFSSRNRPHGHNGAYASSYTGGCVGPNTPSHFLALAFCLQPNDPSGNCWPFRGHQGQVVIRLPARVHVTAITVQHIFKEVSPSGTDISAPRDVAVFGVDADGEEETLLGTFTYSVAKEAIQTFPLKNAPLPRAFVYIKLLVKSNWGNPAYTCIYRVQVHGKMAKPESLD
ncbi:SUN domain-containing protein 5-like [Theristicus caerulescens]